MHKVNIGFIPQAKTAFYLKKNKVLFTFPLAVSQLYSHGCELWLKVI